MLACWAVSWSPRVFLWCNVQASRGALLKQQIHHDLPLCTEVPSSWETWAIYVSVHAGQICVQQNPGPLRAFSSSRFHLRALEINHPNPLLPAAELPEVKNFAQGHLVVCHWREKRAFKLPASCSLSLPVGYLLPQALLSKLDTYVTNFYRFHFPIFLFLCKRVWV